MPLLLLSPSFQIIYAWKQCSTGEGGGVCPDFATCCPTGTAGVSSCIPKRKHDPEDQGQCCNQSTGCGYGYACAVTSASKEPYCQLQLYAPPTLTHDVPRYMLLSVTDPLMLQQIYGFPMDNFQLAYYSNMESLITNNPQVLKRHAKVNIVLIIVHGSAFNADDYLLAAQSSVPETLDPSTVLIVAPYFVRPEDKNVTTTDKDREILRWVDNTGESGKQHSYRYGADAVNAPISSYAAVDTLLEYLSKAEVQFPNLKRAIVTGHSAGGQFVHRWALLSSSPVWDIGFLRDEEGHVRSRTLLYRSIHIRVVVANPRSYCYLDARRLIEGNLTTPDQQGIDYCQFYNTWEWGLDEGGDVHCHYRDAALHLVSKIDIANRYVRRDVVYLAGEFDTEALLDGCMTEDFQGSNRLERSQRYYESLKQMHGREIHRWFQVSRSPHDHWLMYQSDSGRAALFSQ